MHPAAAYAWMRSTIPAYGVCGPTNGCTSAHDAFSFINLSLDDSVQCLFGWSHHNSSRICTSRMSDSQLKPPDRIVDGIRHC